MTPAQQAALEACAGRPLTTDDIAALTPLLVARDDGAIAALLSVGLTRAVRVPIADIQAYLQSHGIWWVLKAAAADAAHPGQQAAAAVIEVASARYDNIDFTLSFVGYIFSSLVAAGLMAQADFDALHAMSMVPAEASSQSVTKSLEGL